MDNMLIYSVIIGIFNLVIYYFVMNSLIGNKVTTLLKTITYKKLIIALCCVIILSAVHFISRTFDVMSPLSFMVIIIGLICFTQQIIKKNKMASSIDEVVLICIAYFIFSQLIIALSTIPEIISNDATPFTFLTLLTSLTIVFLFVLNRVNLNKIFVFITYRLAVKVFIFAIAFAVIPLSTFISDSVAPNIFSTLISRATFLLMIIIGLWHTLKLAHQYEVIAADKYHNMRKILTLLNAKTEDAQTADEFRGLIEASIELMDIKVANSSSKVGENEPIDFEAFIKTNVESLKLNYQSNAEVLMNIRYFEPHKKVTALNINYMLSILLENAFETETTYPILVDIFSTENILLIQVANETTRKTPQDFENMLAKGYSTKRKVGRGFGLSKLKKLVEKLDGTITISQEINVDEQKNYIFFTLNF